MVERRTRTFRSIPANLSGRGPGLPSYANPGVQGTVCLWKEIHLLNRQALSLSYNDAQFSIKKETLAVALESSELRLGGGYGMYYSDDSLVCTALLRLATRQLGSLPASPVKR